MKVIETIKRDGLTKAQTETKTYHKLMETKPSNLIDHNPQKLVFKLRTDSKQVHKIMDRHQLKKVQLLNL